MRRTFGGCVVLSPHTGDIVGVGFDPIGAFADAGWKLQMERRELFDKGYRSVPAKITVTYQKKAAV